MSMSTIDDIKSAIQKLSPGEFDQLLNWIEDQFEMTDEFRASIERGKQDIVADAVARVKRSA